MKHLFSSLHFTNEHYTDMRCGAPFHYLAYMIEGKSRIVCDRLTLTVKAGDVFYIPKNLRYQSYWYGRDIRFLSFGFFDIPTVDFANFDLQTVACSAQTIQKIKAIPLHGSHVSCEVLARFLDAMAEVIPLLSYAPENRAQKLADEIKNQIRTAPHAPLADIARACGISEASLYKRFKQATKITPNKYRQSILCDKASELLITTDLSVEEISEKLNFSSSSYFRKIMKNHTQKTPREIRRTKTI